MIALYILGALFGALFLIILFLMICVWVVDTSREYEDHNKFYRFLLNFTTGACMKLVRVRIHVTGREKLPAEPMLFVSNHRSNYDPIITWYGLRKWNISYISKASNFKIPFFGRCIRRCCFMTIDRDNPRNAIQTINKAAELLKKGDLSIGVYPEGTRSKTCQLLPFHNGVFKIAQKAQTPIAVMCVTGTEKIAKRTPFRRTDVYLDILEVFSSEYVKNTKTEVIGMEMRRLVEINTEKREK